MKKLWEQGMLGRARRCKKCGRKKRYSGKRDYTEIYRFLLKELGIDVRSGKFSKKIMDRYLTEGTSEFCGVVLIPKNRNAPLGAYAVVPGHVLVTDQTLSGAYGALCEFIMDEMI